jgi:hypothetical protein
LTEKNSIPVYIQLVDTIKKGFDLLDGSVQAEVKEFITGRQQDSGLFVARDNSADLYYSLFGAWMAKALGLNQSLESLKGFFTRQGSPSDKTGVGYYASILIQRLLFGDYFRKPGIIFLLGSLSRSTNISLVYRFFFFLLTYDALYGRKMLLRVISGLPLYFYSAPADSPCSFHAAIIIAKKSVGLDVLKESRQLLSYFEEGKGFKIYAGMDNADLLSTAVSLFALKQAGVDLRLQAPSCLQLLQKNYQSGAFTPGDGDQSRDLEYTFYGLLALGALCNKNNNHYAKENTPVKAL